MTDREFPPALNGTELRLDAIVGEFRALRSLVTPAENRTNGHFTINVHGTGDPEKVADEIARQITRAIDRYEDGDTIDLREPEQSAKPRQKKS